jgi:hypothetical protein
LEIEGTVEQAVGWERVFGGGTGSCCWTKLFIYTETQPWVYELGGLMATVSEETIHDYDRILVYELISSPSNQIIRETRSFLAGNQTFNSTYNQWFYFASAYRRTSVRVTIGTVIANCPYEEPVKKWSCVIDMIGEVKAVSPRHFEGSLVYTWTPETGCFNPAVGQNSSSSESNADVGEAGFFFTGTESDPQPMVTRYAHLRESLDAADFFEPTACEDVCGGCSVPCSETTVLIGEPDLPFCTNIINTITPVSISVRNTITCLPPSSVSENLTGPVVIGVGGGSNTDFLNISTDFGTACNGGRFCNCFGDPCTDPYPASLRPVVSWNQSNQLCELEEFPEVSIEVSIPLTAITLT